MNETAALCVEVTDQHGTCREYVAATALKPRQRAKLDALAARLIAGYAALPGCDEDYARKVAVADLTRLLADERAYERVAERKGLLPL